MPQSPSPWEPRSSSGATLERSRCRGQLGADPDPGGAGRTGQATDLADRRGTVPESAAGRNWGTSSPVPAWSSCGAVTLGVSGFTGLLLIDRVRRRPHPRRWPAGRPGPRPLAAERSPRRVLGAADRRARVVQPPSRALRVAAERPGRPGGVAGGGSTSLAKVPLTLFGVWFALSIWIEALFGIASPLTGGRGITGFGLLGRAVERARQRRTASRVRDPRRPCS